jgi:hypothetical protein
MEKHEIQSVIDKLDLSIEAQFVPWSRSRSFRKDAKPTDRNLNWKVTVKRAGRVVVETDYMAGLAHCQSYKQGMRWTIDECKRIELETETGYPADARGHMRVPGSKPLSPDPLDVLHCLLLDAEALEYRDFEDWAENFGYDTDSRKAETTYRACLDIGLKFRNVLGESGIMELRGAFQDY